MRSPGAADAVAHDVLTEPALTPVLVALMQDDAPLLRMRAADALEKVSRQRPDLVAPFASLLVREIGALPQQEVRWHIALMLPRLDIPAGLRGDAVALLQRYLADRSRIVVAEALSALAFFAADDPALHEWLVPVLNEYAVNGAPSARVRARRLLQAMKHAR
ncbi:MAG: hypothetical protein U0031_01865 [Thermomicrobiales bacterium]